MDAARPRLTPEPGTYALELTLPAPRSCTIGALGAWDFPAGHYIYVGSAWGSGGLAARLGRHLRGGRTRHWHVDYLRACAHPTAYCLAPRARLECVWAAHLLALPFARVVVPRFGASDCTCAAHLIYLGERRADSIHLPRATAWQPVPPAEAPPHA